MFGFSAVCRFASILTLGVHVIAQATTQVPITSEPFVPSPVNAIGKIQDISVDDLSNPLSGGSITTNNITFVVPKNLIVQLVNNYVSWRELFLDDGTPNMPLFPQVQWETTVFANRINDVNIAGLVFISQNFVQAGQGFITNIDYSTGEIRIGGNFNDSTSGTRAVINDPVGRYGLVHDQWPIWSADVENPSIFSSSGFPVCIPRFDPAVQDDPLCPKKNRPLDADGHPVQILQFDPPPVADGAPDPNVFAPIEVGDWVFFNGIYVEDPQGADPLMALWALEDNIGLYTSPGSNPVYLTMVKAQWGIIGNPAGEVGQTRVDGFVTDETQDILVYAIDYDPCTGASTERTLSVVVPRTTAVRGQFRYRTQTDDTSPATREMGSRINGKASVTNANGIDAGNFVSPVLDAGFIFPELLVFGQPQIAFDFELMDFLSLGMGPWEGGGTPLAKTYTPPPLVGQLDPFPFTPVPVAAECVLAANAGPDRNVLPGQATNLTVTTNVRPASEIDWLWTQVSGPAVNLTQANTAIAKAQIPPLAKMGTKFGFSVTASNLNGTAATSATSNVTLTVAATAVDTVTILTIDFNNGRGTGNLEVTAETDVTDGSAFLQMSTVNPTIAPTNMTSDGNGQFHLLFNIKPEPELVIITSNLGGIATSAAVNVNNLGGNTNRVAAWIEEDDGILHGLSVADSETTDATGNGSSNTTSSK